MTTGPSRGSDGPGNSHPEIPLGSDPLTGLPPPDDIVTGAILGEWLGLSARSVRDHCARGHVVRAGRGYDLRASIRAYLDHLRIEAAKRGQSEDGRPVWEHYQDALAQLRAAENRAPV